VTIPLKIADSTHFRQECLVRTTYKIAKQYNSQK